MTKINRNFVIKFGRWSDLLFEIVLTLFFMYSFFYQYSYAPITGAFPVFGILIFILSFSRMRRSVKYYYQLIPLFLFAIYITVVSVLVPYDRSISVSLLINHFEYLLPVIGIFTYCDGKLEKLKVVFFGIWLSVSLLAIHSVFRGTVSLSGAISVGTTNMLNTNTLSSFLTIGLVSSLYLLLYFTPSWWLKTIVVVSIGIQLVSQINTASRRGIIVFVFILLSSVFVIVRDRLKHSFFKKFLVFILVLILIAWIYSWLVDNADTLVVFKRFRNSGYLGDVLRKQYQNAAVQLFLESPIFGQGLGAVQKYVGMYSHSMYYELLACTGLLGTILLLGVILLCNLKWFYIYSKRLKEINLSHSIGCLLACILVVSIFLGGVAVVYIYDMYFYIMIAILLSYKKTIIDYSTNLLLIESINEVENDDIEE